MLALSVAALALLPAAPVAGADLELFFDAFMKEQMADLQAPGAVVAFVQDGALAFAKGYGVANTSTGEPANPERTVFRVASISKVFTATAVLQLVASGAVDLDADVNRYLKSMRVADAFGEPVRLWHLLSHTAGFDDRVSGIAARTASELSLRRFVERYQPRRVLPPGDQLSYSNYGACLLGLMIEDVTGDSFATYAEQKILAPLGMHDSSFELPARLERRLAQGYLRRGSELVAVPSFHIHMMPASTLVSTAHDMSRFLLAHLGGGRLGDGAILSPSTSERMQAQLFSQHPELPGNAHGFWEYRRNGRRVLEHGGSWFGYESLFAMLPGEHAGVFLAHTGGDVRLRVRLLEALLDRFYPDPPDLRPPVAAPGVDVSRFAGSYRWNRYARSTFEKAVALVDGWAVDINANADGTVTLRHPADDFPAQRFVPVGDLLLRRDDGDGAIAFRAAPDGRITHLFASVYDLPIVGERVPGFLLPAVQLPFGLACLTAVSSAGLVAPLRSWRRRRRGLVNATALRYSDALGFALFAVHLLFFAGLAWILGPPDFMEPAFGEPAGLDVVRSIPLLGLPLTAGLLGLAALRWWKGEGSLGGRVYHSVVAAGGAGLATFLALINWLGPF